MSRVLISSTIRKQPIKGPFDEIKKDILGARYQLSLTYVGATRAARLNKEHRNKEYVPNILSFPLTESVGEIYICPEVATKEAVRFDMTPAKYNTFLFIHGCLHLKGYDHGDTMDTLERKYIRKYKLQKHV